jgi:hypothetical protein
MMTLGMTYLMSSYILGESIPRKLNYTEGNDAAALASLVLLHAARS